MSAEEKKTKTETPSQIPVLSPTHFKRTGSLKLRNEMRMPHKTPPESTSTPNPPLRRHRSLVCFTGFSLRFWLWWNRRTRIHFELIFPSKDCLRRYCPETWTEVLKETMIWIRRKVLEAVATVCAGTCRLPIMGLRIVLAKWNISSIVRPIVVAKSISHRRKGLIVL